MKINNKRSGFTLAELIIVVSILAILAGVLVPRFQVHMKGVRDQRRLGDLKAIQRAIEQYYTDHGDYPPVEGGADSSWDDSHIGEFIPALVHNGYLNDFPRDPVNDRTYFYSYYVYNTNRRCPETPGNSSGHYYILRLKAFEDPNFAAKHDSGLSCGGTDFKRNYAYVLGGGAVLQ